MLWCARRGRQTGQIQGRSKLSMAAAFSSVSPMSSSPFSRQCFLKASTSKAKVWPSEAVTVCAADRR
jgi:hypothetical protein